VARTHPVAKKLRFDLHIALRVGCRGTSRPVAAIRTRIVFRAKCTSIRETSDIGQRTLQLGSPSGGVNFFNAICRLLIYEGSFSTRFSDLLISTDSFVLAESVSAGVGLRSSLSVSIGPLQLINTMVSSTARILNPRQVGCTRGRKCFEAANHG
jgi:hypothetical protein